MIERKVTAKSARSVLFEEFNDIDIYVEDTAEGYKKIYKELLNKVFEGTLRIEHILPLGDRNEVIQECAKNQESNGRKRVYIVDGDLYLLNNVNPPPLKGLFVLQKYCIENYLIDKDAIVEVYYEESPDLELKEIEEKLDFESWIIENDELLTDLFVTYALCNKYAIQGTVSYHVSKLFSDTSAGAVCQKKIKSRIDELTKKLEEKISAEKIAEELQAIKERINDDRAKSLRYVSGKDYLMPLLKSKLKTFIKSSSSNVVIYIRLAVRCNIKELEEIKSSVFE